MQECMWQGCEKPQRCRGLCKTHYERARRSCLFSSFPITTEVSEYGLPVAVAVLAHERVRGTPAWVSEIPFITRIAPYDAERGTSSLEMRGFVRLFCGKVKLTVRGRVWVEEMLSTKICRHCLRDLDKALFHTDRGRVGTLRPECKECRGERLAEIECGSSRKAWGSMRGARDYQSAVGANIG